MQDLHSHVGASEMWTPSLKNIRVWWPSIYFALWIRWVTRQLPQHLLFHPSMMLNLSQTDSPISSTQRSRSSGKLWTNQVAQKSLLIFAMLVKESLAHSMWCLKTQYRRPFLNQLQNHAPSIHPISSVYYKSCQQVTDNGTNASWVESLARCPIAEKAWYW